MIKINRIIIAIILCLTLTICCTACGAAYSQHQQVLGESAALSGITNASAVLMQNGEVKWTGKYGNDSTKDLYCIGSISKSFVAVLTLLLEQDGVISLDAKISDYLPELELGYQSGATLRELLSMRSGIGNYTEDFDTDDYFKEYTTQDLIDIGLRNSVAPGEFLYSNTNILIAKLMIERATGESCETLIKNKILIPLKLDNTFFAQDKQRIKDRLVPGFSNTRLSDRVEFTYTTTSWSGLACGMYATAENMARWANSIVNSSFLSDESRQKLFEFLAVSDKMEYGLCIIREKLGDKEVIKLLGNVPGYSTAVLIDGNTITAVLCNLSNYSGTNRSYADEITNDLEVP